jgi:hypothetical protein
MRMPEFFLALPELSKPAKGFSSMTDPPMETKGDVVDGLRIGAINFIDPFSKVFEPSFESTHHSIL